MRARAGRGGGSGKKATSGKPIRRVGEEANRVVKAAKKQAKLRKAVAKRDR